jgi:hypothetical protein
VQGAADRALFWRAASGFGQTIQGLSAGDARVMLQTLVAEYFTCTKPLPLPPAVLSHIMAAAAPGSTADVAATLFDDALAAVCKELKTLYLPKYLVSSEFMNASNKSRSGSVRTGSPVSSKFLKPGGGAGGGASGDELSDASAVDLETVLCRPSGQTMYHGFLAQHHPELENVLSFWNECGCSERAFCSARLRRRRARGS